MKTNKTFAILSAIGIIMVVSAHANSVLNLFEDFFPYNSFFMPMFIFISGYFFKDKNVITLSAIKDYIKKKIKNLLLYYFIWNIIYGIIRIILYKLELDNHFTRLNLYTIFIQPFIDGQQFGLNSPSWFIPTLFMVEITFIVIRKIQIYINKKTNNSIIELMTLIILIVLNIFCVYVSKECNYSKFLLPFSKLGFFLFFFQLGKFYKDKLETKDNKFSTGMVLLITITINIVCIKILIL